LGRLMIQLAQYFHSSHLMFMSYQISEPIGCYHYDGAGVFLQYFGKLLYKDSLLDRCSVIDSILTIILVCGSVISTNLPHKVFLIFFLINP
jgi:hypothetical protein